MNVGWTRRSWLRVGAVGAIGLPELVASDSLRAELALFDRRGSFGRARRCILLFLTGGPPQHDTFDPKPDAPAEIRGELSPIATSAPGVFVSELFPQLAHRADKYCILRSVAHDDRTHATAGYTMLTGMPHIKANSASAADVRPTPDDHPHLGALVSLARPAPSVPTFVSIPEIIRDAAVNTFPGQDGGFLGPRFSPLRIEGDASTGRFRPPALVLPSEISIDRLDSRRHLLAQLDRIDEQALAGAARHDDGLKQKAFSLLRTTAVKRALQIEAEPVSRREAYGDHLFGKGCLLARRMIEAGVSLATVYWHYEGPDDSPVWDTHENNYPHMRNRLALPTDKAVAALLDDLAARGLLDDTLVICMGEFGRSPRINKQGGRDHWSQVASVLVAGAGIPGGVALGSSDRHGGYPAEMPVSPADLFATFLHLLGVPATLEVVDRLGRRLPACTGKPIAALT